MVYGQIASYQLYYCVLMAVYSAILDHIIYHIVIFYYSLHYLVSTASRSTETLKSVTLTKPEYGDEVRPSESFRGLM